MQLGHYRTTQYSYRRNTMPMSFFFGFFSLETIRRCSAKRYSHKQTLVNKVVFRSGYRSINTVRYHECLETRSSLYCTRFDGRPDGFGFCVHFVDTSIEIDQTKFADYVVQLFVPAMCLAKQLLKRLESVGAAFKLTLINSLGRLTTPPPVF